MRQKDVAAILGVNEATVYNWERNHTAPAERHRGRVMRFLGDDAR